MNSFPTIESDPGAYKSLTDAYYKLELPGLRGQNVFGYILPHIAGKMPWSEDWQVDDTRRTISAKNAEVPLTEAFARLLEEARQGDLFSILRGWRNEQYAVRGLAVQEAVSMERAGSALFGINTYGVHMTMYVRSIDEGLKIWVPRRSSSKQTYGGMLDNTVAGGLACGEQPLSCLVREAAEEASLPRDVVQQAKACGVVSYVHLRDSRAGGETGLVQPECQYVYDLEVDPEVQPKPNDDEVEAFYLWPVAEVQRQLARGNFKPNCASVLLDFLIRHGIVTAENEPEYVDIIACLHRRLPFPT